MPAIARPCPARRCLSLPAAPYSGRTTPDHAVPFPSVPAAPNLTSPCSACRADASRAPPRRTMPAQAGLAIDAGRRPSRTCPTRTCHACRTEPFRTRPEPTVPGHARPRLRLRASLLHALPSRPCSWESSGDRDRLQRPRDRLRKLAQSSNDGPVCEIDQAGVEEPGQLQS